MSYKNQIVSVIIPAHNEALSIGLVVAELKSLQINGGPLVDTIIVCDNASDDNTTGLARDAGATVIVEKNKGYGFACLAAMRLLDRKLQDSADRGYVVFVDGDHSVDTNEIPKLLALLDSGYDLVVGSRENDALQRGALGMHQRFGNKLASLLIRLLWQQSVTDLGPFRAIRYSALQLIDMQDQRFGWTVEMQVKAIQAGLKYTEAPVATRRRIGVSKISGTISGTIGAAIGIFSKIFRLYLAESQFTKSLGKVAKPKHKTRQA